MTDNENLMTERLIKLRTHLCLSSKDFAAKAGIDPSNYSSIETGKRSFGNRVMQDICNAFDVNIDWLRTGKGEMLKEAVPSEHTKKTATTGKLIPLYDAEAAAGVNYSMSMEPISRSVGVIEIGSLLKDSEIALRVYGNSMVPNYPAGCVLGLRPHMDSFIEPGAVYVVETEDNRYLKRLYNNNENSAFKCVSDNHMVHDAGPMKGEFFYPAFEIPFGSVRKLFRVVGVIKRNTL